MTKGFLVYSALGVLAAVTALIPAFPTAPGWAQLVWLSGWFFFLALIWEAAVGKGR